MTQSSMQRRLPRVSPKTGLLALALLAGLGAAALGAGSAEARHGRPHGHHHHHHHHRVWSAGWYAHPIYGGPHFHRCHWVKQVRFIPGHGRVVRWRPVCRY